MPFENKVRIIGYVQDNPVVRTTERGTKVANFTVITEERGKLNAAPTKYYHRCVLWEPTDEFDVQASSSVSILGKLRHRSYEKKDGTKQAITEVVVDDWSPIAEMLAPRAANPQGKRSTAELNRIAADHPF